MLKCSECGKGLNLLKAYRHPVEGKEKIVCGCCWDKVKDSECRYTSFILDHVKKTGIGFICFILIKVAPTFETDAYNKLKNLPETIEICPLMGKYDFIVKTGAENFDELGSYIVNTIRKIDGITSTKTLTGAYSLAGEGE
jgi:DNA-binding Lrp family transcriptional regulator